MVKYLIRLDDACDTQDIKKWNKIEEILDKYKIKPLVGIVPYNEDSKLKKNINDKEFWKKAQKWQEKGWEVCMHGYNHVHSSHEGGINPVHNRSEFAGVPFTEQREKIKIGYDILKKNGIVPRIFYAPSHTFDENTLKALKEQTDIRIISDTIALKPYKYNDFIFIPQQMGRARKMRFGLYTFCYHPNEMREKDFFELEEFIKKNNKSISCVENIKLLGVKKINLRDKILKKIYFIYRKLKKEI